MWRLSSILIMLLLIISVTSQTTDLDLREANVTGVEFSKDGDTKYEFSVTIYHDDDGEDGYADWWIVEHLNGSEYGIRILTHAHGTQEFTRSGAITITDSPQWVVARGHDQDHDYGGQVIFVNLESSALILFNQGNDIINFTDYNPDTISGTPITSTGKAQFRQPLLAVFALMTVLLYRKNRSKTSML